MILSQQSMSQVDALWTLIQSQKVGVRKALYKRMQEEDTQSKELLSQQIRIRQSIEKGWREIQDAKRTGQPLQSADELLEVLSI